MSPLRTLLFLTLLAVLAGCQLYFINTEDDEDNGNGRGNLTLRILGAEGAGFQQVVLRVYEVQLWRDDGTVRRFDVDFPTLELFSGADGQVLLNGVDLPSGTYDRIRLGVEGDPVDDLSYVDDGLGGGRFPLDVEQDRVDFDVSFDVQRGSRRTVGLVVHTASAIRLRTDLAQDYFRLFGTGYAVRHDRSGLISGELPCPGNSGDDAAVYVYRSDAMNPTDIQGRLSSVNEPVVSFAADDSLAFTSPRLPEGNWRVSYSCSALDDDPGEPSSTLTSELRDNVQEVEVERGQTVTVVF